jgi:hypothetical protein
MLQVLMIIIFTLRERGIQKDLLYNESRQDAAPTDVLAMQSRVPYPVVPKFHLLENFPPRRS